ncbi:hypothetical protein FB45DRAFT_1013645 [Roridomyces roridus]|uniref:F-box domain-containing protein n=1 Tax=Roridomyces roridus TaxID=1738132 RepID=A0AAD7AYB5_9AGAR|nr:hypothetical protein FB45DRAFT_1013645 [Roridomyces roridus]
MSSHKRFPTELWLEILQFLPRDSLHAVYATDRTFKNASRALLLSHLVFSPYYDRRAERARREHHLAAPDGITFALDRLAFWSSDEIAPFVRQCTITLRVQLEGETTPVPLRDADAPHILMTSILDRLAKFPRLKKLYAKAANFNQAGVTNLCQLPLLTEIAIEWCGVLPGETINASGLELRTTKFSYSNFPAPLSGFPGTPWLSLLHPGHLRELTANGNWGAVGDIIVAGTAFPHVRKLHLGMDFNTMNKNLASLAKFPVVRELQISGWGQLVYEAVEAPAVRASDVLPLLREYSGPCRLLPILLDKPSLTHLTLERCTPSELLAQLHGEHSRIASLHATLYDPKPADLSSICRSFPALVDLCVRISAVAQDSEFEDGVNMGATNFFTALVDMPCLPSTLRRLAISWDLVFDSDDEDMEPVEASPRRIPDFVAIRNALRERCPALATLWLDGYDFRFKWRQLLGREEVEQENMIKPGTSEEGFVDFWEGR